MLCVCLRREFLCVYNSSIRVCFLLGLGVYITTAADAVPRSCCVCEVGHQGSECVSVLFLSDVGWSGQVVERRIPGVGLFLGRACLLVQCVGYVRGSVLFLSDVDWAWRFVVERICGEDLCLGHVCLLMQCVGSCGRCLMAFVGCGVVEGRGEGY